jgi:hypothetical protein
MVKEVIFNLFHRRFDKILCWLTKLETGSQYSSVFLPVFYVLHKLLVLSDIIVFNYSLHFMHPSIDKYNSFIYSMRRVLVKLKLSLEMQSLSEQSTINIGLHCK